MREDDFERLYAEHAKPLFAFLAYRTGDPVLAEDLLADTFERALRARARFDRRKASERTWLYSIALNRLRDHARRQASAGRGTERARAAAEVAAPSDPLAGVEHRDEVRRALEGLAPEEREVIALRFGAELTVPEIAKLTGRRLSTVEGRLYRGLAKLRERLG